ncbi:MULTISPECIES: MetQ/NlpA family ABC transporter substrate-binding protein [unclassified Rathayibacter]|jgi:D-methionine transport system substrate-binding protein|uniref:MetQ/NlpA family ABC transporter substrate-binding protein n=1 Tax=unclassified Rathayibacter TaxID=2609250 RepID=UPI000CE733AF|nr:MULTISPECIES: MetQ/NlpA family ABC transporter substrate-binding protein [unclassified Rathayibacter]PPG53513.1 methionine ABC transporter substrate-binding protein [Rathayibacter sp. AY2B3]PPI23937.1 methionine ABC transporter substrate-binding protein [Rathayibacter sp. AY1B6]PPI27066.1 methionine ABC transporter substrate-binding protein [Rathayibacter sp. AY1B5]PPI34773.1 methionine ABC transporter substrate-binding protein [Rathayibacter sp. AY1B1]
MTLRTRLLATSAIAASAALLLAGCSGAGGGDDTVRIGVVGASDPYWATYEKAAADAGIDIEIVDFSDYNQPNPALTEGEIDLNQFQHIAYLAQYNTSADADLVPIGATAIYPLGLYSSKYDDVADIPAGSTIAIPNDETNQARALLVLQSAGLVELKDGGGVLSNVDDVEPSSKVQVTALEASLTPTSLPDVAAAVINNDFIENAGLNAEDAIAQDDPSDPASLLYTNVFAARADDASNETYTKLVSIYQDSQDVLDGVSEQSGGTAVFLKTPASELETSLESAETDISAAS